MRRSKQLNFFIHPDDWESIVKFNQSQKVMMMGTKSTIYEIEKVDHFKFQVYLTQQHFIDNREIHFDDETTFIDLSSSSIVEFSLGGFYPNSLTTLHRGRLYYVKSYWAEGSIESKGNDFNAWAIEYFRLFKRTFLKKNEFDKTYQMSNTTIDWATKNKAAVDPSGLVLVGRE
jgi:hypothetical protein